MNNILIDLSVIGSIASIISIFYARYSLRQIKKSIRTGFSLDIIRIIEDVNREKSPFLEKDRDAYNILFRMQGELEVLHNKLLETFSIKDIRKNQ